MKDKLNNELKVGDILFNPYADDMWIVSKRYNEEKEADELYIKLVHNDYDEDICIAKSFFKVGNVYDLDLYEKDKNAKELNIKKVDDNNG